MKAPWLEKPSRKVTSVAERGMTDEKKPVSARTQLYYIRDPRQRSPFAGKPEGGWLRYPPSPAVWVRSRIQAQSFAAVEIEAIRKGSPYFYFEGCGIVPADDAG